MSSSFLLSNLGATIKSIVKLPLQSRRTSIGKHTVSDNGRGLVIMGNGPSLRGVIDNHREWLSTHDLLAVNFAATVPDYRELKPRYYFLADPVFFGPESSHPNLPALHKGFRDTDWPMLLIVPAVYRKQALKLVGGNKFITVATVNAIGVEGFGWFERFIYGHRLAMPRPRNVLIPALMAGIWLGYENIDIVGADHSWMQSIWVDGKNRVVSVQPHFYKDDKAEQERVDTTNAGYKLHDIIYSFFLAFSSYHRIAGFAGSRGVKIVNRTEGSYIDAFTRELL